MSCGELSPAEIENGRWLFDLLDRWNLHNVAVDVWHRKRADLQLLRELHVLLAFLK